MLDGMSVITGHATNSRLPMLLQHCIAPAFAGNKRWCCGDIVSEQLQALLHFKGSYQLS
jgi:hypothetical protein